MKKTKSKHKERDIPFRFETVEKAENTHLYLYGEIAKNDWWDDVVSANGVKDKLKKIESDVIHVHINSNGGDVFEGIAIHNLLDQYDGQVNIYVDGLAASAASIIAMAGQTIFMPTNTMMMVHNPWTYVNGNADSLRDMADQLDKIEDSILETYLHKFVGTKEELKALFDEETWMTAEEAYSFGLCDEILSEQKEEPVSAKASLLNKYQCKVDNKEKEVDPPEPKNILDKFEK